MNIYMIPWFYELSLYKPDFMNYPWSQYSVVNKIGILLHWYNPITVGLKLKDYCTLPTRKSDGVHKKWIHYIYNFFPVTNHFINDYVTLWGGLNFHWSMKEKVHKTMKMSLKKLLKRQAVKHKDKNISILPLKDFIHF